MVIATFVEYPDFKAAYQTWHPNNATVFKASTTVFTAAIVSDDGVVLRLFVAEEPQHFNSDFPHAILANTIVST